jgi:hypothetical protein
MSNRFFHILLAGCLPVLALTGLPLEAAEKTKVVIQVSENTEANWNLALNNARNIQKDLGKDNAEIEIVAYGPGINMLKFDSPVASRVNEAAADGVGFRACGNTMKNQKLTKQDMHEKAAVVPSGVVHAIKRQNEGWAYIKP